MAVLEGGKRDNKHDFDVGKIVHYKRHDKDVDPYPAMMTFLDGERAHLTVFYHRGIEHVQSAMMAENFDKAKAGQWCWPPERA